MSLFKAKRGIDLNPERDTFKIPHSVQESIPIKRIYKDGIFEVAGKFSKSWGITDINYALASPEDKKGLFLAYCGILNLLPVGSTAKLTLFNRPLVDVELSELLMPHMGDGLDVYRDDHNNLVRDKAALSNNLIQEKYITISTTARSLDEARSFFNRVHGDLSGVFAGLGSTLRELNINERLRVLHAFFRPGEAGKFRFDLDTAMKRGHDFKDSFAPESLSFKRDHFEMGDQVGRVLFLRDYASFIKDDLITSIMDTPRTMMLSIDIVPMDMETSIKLIDKKIMAVESDITRWQQRQNQNNNFSSEIPYQLKKARESANEYMDDLTERDQRLMLVLVTLAHLAYGLDELDQDTKSLQARARGCEFATLQFQQEDGLNTVLPYGLRRIEAVRTLTTESTAVLMPFRAPDIRHRGGLFYGVNAETRNMVFIDRGSFSNGNGIVAGMTGAGKSLTVKLEILYRALSCDDTIIIVDPEREYGELVRAIGGEVITLSANSSTYINAMDLSEGYGEGDPLKSKSDFIMSFLEQIMGEEDGDSRAKSIIDRCTRNIYKDYIKRHYKGEPPTLVDLHKELENQPEPLAKDIALALERYAKGSLDIFAHQTNIDINSRIVCFDIQGLGENLRPAGLLVMMDYIWNRLSRGREAKKYTHIFVDELHLFFKTKSSSEFFSGLWSRARKYYGFITGVTQNIDVMLRINDARDMLNGSEFLILLKQSASNRAALAELLGISNEQLGYLNKEKHGYGLVKAGTTFVPLLNLIPEDTATFEIVKTRKPNEVA